MKILSVVGARPNFMKIAPFIRAISQSNININHVLVHTGQHYDDRMSKSFFETLSIPPADINLGIGSGSHAEQVGKTMIAFEKVLQTEKPDWVVVIGDVNATLACSVTAKKMHISVCHIEAGLRSGDLSMPEEINRLVTDRLSDLLLTPDEMSNVNLVKEGVEVEKIKFVGNIMIDTLEQNRQEAKSFELEDVIQENTLAESIVNAKTLIDGEYAVLTMHRPSNVDTRDVLESLFCFLSEEVALDMPIVWPIHPRTKKMLQDCNLWSKALKNDRILLLHPVGYHEMLRLNMGARVMLTDSGGLQEECCVLGTPCLTLRWNTERPITLKKHGGASVLVGNNVSRIRREYLEILKVKREPRRPKLWDGRTAERILEAILEHSSQIISAN